jgi:hypothetical protein
MGKKPKDCNHCKNKKNCNLKPFKKHTCSHFTEILDTQCPKKYLYIVSDESDQSVKIGEVTQGFVKEIDKLNLKISESKLWDTVNRDFGISYCIIVRVL